MTQQLSKRNLALNIEDMFKFILHLTFKITVYPSLEVTIKFCWRVKLKVSVQVMGWGWNLPQESVVVVPDIQFSSAQCTTISIYS